MVESLKKQNGIGQLEEAIWKKLVARMYDERDCEVITMKLLDLIEAKKEAKENEFSANFFTRGVNLNGTLNNVLLGGGGVNKPPSTRKLTREQENAKRKQIKLESRIRYNELVDTVLAYQLVEHEKFLGKFTREFKRVDLDGIGVLNEPQFKLLLNQMH